MSDLKNKIRNLVSILFGSFLLFGLVSMAIPAMADTLPAVIGTTPADTATGVAANSVITAVFNEAAGSIHGYRCYIYLNARS